MWIPVNQILKSRLPGLHSRLKAATEPWRNSGSPRWPVPARIAGQFTWVHPRVFTSDATRTEPHIVRWIDDHLQPGGIFFDVGAHCGWLTIRAARRVSDGGRVVAFEPSPFLAGLLAYHKRVNRLRQITIVPAAVSNTDGEAPFFLLNGGFSFRNSLAIGGDVPFVRPEEKTAIKVATVTLDRYCQNESCRPTVLKIDVEGAEQQVLEGGRELLRSARPVVIVGLHPYWMPSGQSEDRVFALLEECGYRVSERVVQTAQGYGIGDYLCLP
jgi:FkbM family methyltransferase